MSGTASFMSLSRLLWLLVGVLVILGLVAALSVPAYRSGPDALYSVNENASVVEGFAGADPSNAQGKGAAGSILPAAPAPMAPAPMASIPMSQVLRDDAGQAADRQSASGRRESNLSGLQVGAPPAELPIARNDTDQLAAVLGTEARTQARAEDTSIIGAGSKALVESEADTRRARKSERQRTNVADPARRAVPPPPASPAPRPALESATTEGLIGNLAKDRDREALAPPSLDEKADRKAGRRVVSEAKRVTDVFRGTHAAGAASFADAEVLSKRPARRPAHRSVPPSIGIAQRWLAAREQVEGITAQHATGYWANTYRPGDPAMRLLSARLRRGGQPALLPVVKRNRQPFDLPVHGAMAVYLQSDRSAIEGRQRVRLQVGLQATERLSGWRPAMHVALVLDPGTANRGWPTFEALALALAAARQPGDRFTLFLAGHDTPLVHDADFRHGPVKLALVEAPRHTGSNTRPLAADLRHAYAFLHGARSNADPGLGASLVLLASASEQAPGSADLDTLVHQQALAGHALSALAAEGAGNLAALERLAGLGQGRLKAVAQPAEAGGVIGDELHSAARVVARALRLRIRLAPGVELVNVPGSHRLDVRSTSRVKAAEKAQDRLIARQLGIEADRGRDEEGIQIVMPAFHAGDSHAIVIDVIAPGPGPVADVRLRYKDLVNFTNAVSRASLSLSAGEDIPGPLNRNVLKNELAIHVAQAARQAAVDLTNGNVTAAARTLQGEFELLGGLREIIPGWQEDIELQRDGTLLAGLLRALDSNDGGQLASALTLAAFRRLNPPYR